MLRALHDLDVIDKHKIIVATLHYISVSHSEPDECFTVRMLGSRIGERVVAQFALEGVAHEKPKFAPNVTFGDGQPLQGRPIVAALVDFASVVKDAIQAFETLCYGP